MDEINIFRGKGKKDIFCNLMLCKDILDLAFVCRVVFHEKGPLLSVIELVMIL